MSSHCDQLLEGGGLRVRFAFREDRYAHEISLTDGSRWTPLLRSVEGSPLDDWPASPPLQSLHLETRNNRSLALLVGMAGKSHWSVSVELDPAARSLAFDVACRARGVGPLESSYRALEPCEFDSGQQSAVAKSGSVSLQLAARSEIGPALLEPQANGFKIVATGLTTAAPQTVRWGYTIVLGGEASCE